MQNSHRFFSNKDCKHFPCHARPGRDDFNCLFCFCPLYHLGERCGGDFTLTEKGVKNCKDCSIPHHPEGYDHVIEVLKREKS